MKLFIESKMKINKFIKTISNLETEEKIGVEDDTIKIL